MPGAMVKVRPLPGWADQAPAGRHVCPECSSYYVETVVVVCRMLPLHVVNTGKYLPYNLQTLYRCVACGWVGNRPHALV
jgi:hypothetical protein